MITTHVLDIGRGCPAAAVAVTLDVRRAGEWIRLAAARTDDRGRVSSLLPAPAATAAAAAPPGDIDGAAAAAAGSARPAGEVGRYRLTFDVAEYHRGHGVAGFFPEVQVVFDVHDAAAHVHVPLVISPFGYSTYKGT